MDPREGEFDAIELMGRRIWGLFTIMIAIFGVVASTVPGAGLFGVIICIAALMLTTAMFWDD